MGLGTKQMKNQSHLMVRWIMSPSMLQSRVQALRRDFGGFGALTNGLSPLRLAGTLFLLNGSPKPNKCILCGLVESRGGKSPPFGGANKTQLAMKKGGTK